MKSILEYLKGNNPAIPRIKVTNGEMKLNDYITICQQAAREVGEKDEDILQQIEDDILDHYDIGGGYAETIDVDDYFIPEWPGDSSDEEAWVDLIKGEIKEKK